MVSLEACRIFSAAALSLVCVLVGVRVHAGELLVAMAHADEPAGGTVERYDGASARHLGTFLRGLDHPNAVAFGPDGDLFVATGRVRSAGAVLRFDGTNGRPKGVFVGPAPGEPGHLARASHLVWHDGDLFVVSCDDSRVHRYDGLTGAYEATVAVGNPAGWITQIAFLGGDMLTTEFSEARVRRFPIDFPGDTAAAPFLERPGFSPWGIAVDPEGTTWWSGTGGVARFDGRRDEIVIPADRVTTPVAIAISPAGLLACASAGRREVTLWELARASPTFRHAITERVLDPGGMAFTDRHFVGPTPFGSHVEQPSNTGRNWLPTGRAVFNLAAAPFGAAIAAFGLDTEGGDRAKTNLLRAPIRLLVTLEHGRVVDSSLVESQGVFGAGSATFTIPVAAGIVALWTHRIEGEAWEMEVALGGDEAAQVTRVEVVVPFDPRAMGTSLLAEDWGPEGAVRAPLVVNALDMGQLRLSGVDGDETLDCRFTGSRLRKEVDLSIDLGLGGASGRTQRSIELRAVRLDRPTMALVDDAGWARVRRGLVALVQLTPYVPAHEAGSQWLGSPGGITGNNVISDPVSVGMERNFQWLGGMGKVASIGGIDLHKVARRTIEFWLDERMNEDGSLDYVLQRGNISADSNTSVLNAAIDHYLATGDREFVRRNRDRLVRAAAYIVSRDVDDDGLIETFRDGNGGNQFGDTGYD
ncbi:MAG: Virginiamycin lyase, partial [Planctomycetota bacterium]